MALPPGTYRLGPGDGTLSVRTKRTGAAAKAGHNLLIDVTAWEATLTLGADAAESSLELDVDATSLRVREGTGGMQELGDDDKANIEQTIDDEVLMRQGITFRSTRVQPDGGGDGFHVEGDLTLVGTTHALAFDVAVVDGARLSAVAVVKQSDWGMKPYSALFGALKVVDEVEVAIDAALPRAAGAPAPPRAVPSALAADESAAARDDFPVLGAWVTVTLVLGAEIVAALMYIR